MQLPPIQKPKIILIIGIVLGLIAILMVKLYLDQQQRLVFEKAKRSVDSLQRNQLAVLVAKQDIPRGSAITSSLVTTEIIPKQYAQPQVATSMDRIDGMVTIAPMSKGEQITLNKLSQAGQQRGNLASLTPAGKRAVSVEVDNISSLISMINPGDYVDVSYVGPIPIQTPDGKMSSQVAAIPLFQNILVLAVGQETGISVKKEERYQKESKQSGALPPITLALTPQEASLASFLQEQGKIRLTLRSPADAKSEPLPPASWETLFQYIMPKEDAKSKAGPVRQEDYVEIYRGLNKEKIPLSQ